MKGSKDVGKVLTSILFCVPLAMTMMTQGCKSKEAANVAPAAAPKLAVTTLQPTAAKLTKSYSSSIEGVVNVEIRPQVSGSLLKIYVDEGAYVKAGQALFLIDDRVYKQQLNTALGALHTAEANMEAARINVDKTVPLVENKVTSDINLQTAKASYAAAKATVEQASAAVESARINVGYCTISAPVSGYIGRIPFRLGSLVSPSGPQALTLLSDIHNVYVYFAMGETDFVQFEQQHPSATTNGLSSKNASVSLQLADGSLYNEPGKITAVEGQFDKATGSITLRATFPNPKSALRSGNTGRIIIDQQLNDAILVPIASTVEVQDKIYAYVLDESNKVTQTAIPVVGKSGTNYIISGGLSSGSRIVQTGFDRLQNGMTIVPDTATH